MKKIGLIILFLLGVLVEGPAQINKLSQNGEKNISRKTAVAGQFYPDDPVELQSALKDLFTKAEKRVSGDPVKIIVAPHAGYVYSGLVAAASYNQIEPQQKFDNIFILATSHRTQFNGASIYSIGDYETPLGRVRVNRELANNLIESNKEFKYIEDAHKKEHSIEVQLPFLQYHLKNDFRIVPIILGTHDPGDCKEIADVLKPFFNENNLFVVSTDFSHYPKYTDALNIDHLTADALTSMSPNRLIKTIQSNTNKNVDNLVTSMCGWPGMLSMLYITEGREDIKPRKILYRNSGDVMEAKDRVVGYWAIAFYKKQTGNNDMSFELNEQEKEELLNIARETLEMFIRKGRIPKITKERRTETLDKPAGAFVTLHKNGELRGCIGRFDPDEPLYKVVQNMVIASSTQDIRFSEVQEDELDKIEIEISVLTPMVRANSIDEIELGVHGVYIKQGAHSGTFLPQVAKMTNWSKEEFLSHCARDKAGLNWDAWKDEATEIYTYRAISFNENRKLQ